MGEEEHPQSGQRPYRQLTARQKTIFWAVFVAVLLITAAYSFEWTGFGESVRQLQPNQNLRRAKTLWDWLQLLVVPATIALGVFWLNARQSQRERDMQEQRAQDEALQAYIVRMSDWLLDRGLRTSREDDEVRALARAQTLALLARLDPYRKSSVLQFLYETNLIHKDNPVVKLSGFSILGSIAGAANLEGVKLDFVYLGNADLSGTNMSGADLAFSHLPSTNLSETDLSEANLTHADLSGADLRWITLTDTDMTAAILSGAILQDVIFWNTNLREADLSGANLQGADFGGAVAVAITGADLRDTDLTDADLTGADLTGAQITEQQLAQCASLEGATMPDG